MPRIRTIQPHFSRSPSIRRISRDARFLFVLLWTIADDDGRCRAAPDDLAKVLYPQESDVPLQIGRWLDELEAEGCIERYEHESLPYLHVVHWNDFQVICHPVESRLPAPPSEAKGGTPNGSPDDSRILEHSRMRSGRGRKIPRGQALEDRSEAFLENAALFEREAAELAAAGGLTPERIESYLDLALRRSIAAEVEASPARYIELAGRLRGMWGSRGAAAAGKELQAPPEKRDMSPAEIHGLPVNTNGR
jgi:hypothetical protein